MRIFKTLTYNLILKIYQFTIFLIAIETVSIIKKQLATYSVHNFTRFLIPGSQVCEN